MADSGNATDQQQCWSCPFYKNNPMLHAACVHLQLKRIKDVKEHLQKKHQLPLYCPTCGRYNFVNMASRDDHVSARQCTEPPDGVRIEGLDQGQAKALVTRANRKHTTEEQWMDIWEIVFPNRPWPDSPFMGDYLVESIRMIVDYWKSHGTSLLTSASVDQPHHVAVPRLLEALLNGVLGSNAAANGRSAPRPIRLPDPHVVVNPSIAPEAAAQGAGPLDPQVGDFDTPVGATDTADFGAFNAPLAGLGGPDISSLFRFKWPASPNGPMSPNVPHPDPGPHWDPTRHHWDTGAGAVITDGSSQSPSAFLDISDGDGN